MAREAVRLAPWSPPLLDGYAAVLVDLGHCAQAVDVQLRALEVLSERASEAARQALKERLHQIRVQCRMVLAPAAFFAAFRRIASPAFRSSGSGASKRSGFPVRGWSKASRQAWSACRPIAAAARRTGSSASSLASRRRPP